MEPPIENPQPPAWRSRAFVRPLIIGLVGVAASVLFAGIATEIMGPCEGAECTVQGLVNLLLYFPLLLVPGLLITGFLAALSSPDAWAALKAVALAVVIEWLAGGALYTVASGSLEIISVTLFLGIFAAWGAIPLLVGFGIARLVRRLRSGRRYREAG